MRMIGKACNLLPITAIANWTFLVTASMIGFGLCRLWASMSQKDDIANNASAVFLIFTMGAIINAMPITFAGVALKPRQDEEKQRQFLMLYFLTSLAAVAVSCEISQDGFGQKGIGFWPIIHSALGMAALMAFLYAATKYLSCSARQTPHAPLPAHEHAPDHLEVVAGPAPVIAAIYFR